MENRWFTSLIVLLWLTTTTWLVVSKVVPPLRRGEPPKYGSVYHVDDPAHPEQTAVGWNLSLGDRPLGWALTYLEHTSDVTKVESRIHFNRIPLLEFAQPWMKAIIRTTLRGDEDMQMDVGSELQIDTLGHLSNFTARLRIDELRNAILIRGKVQGPQLTIKVEAFDSDYEFQTYLPPDALITDELAPQARLVGLHLGQEWTVPVFSPLRDPRSPMDILQAQVESRDVIMWDEQATPVNVIVYRADSGSAMSSTTLPRSKLWVCDDGTVLKQEVSILNTKLTFVRQSEEASQKLYANRDDSPLQFSRPGPGGFGGLRLHRNPAATDQAPPQDPAPSPEPVQP